MLVALGHKQLETSLVQMPLSFTTAMCPPASNVRGAKPTHETRKVFGHCRLQDQVPMISHEAVAKDANSRISRAGFLQELNEGGVVAIFGEDVHAAVAAIEDMANAIVGQAACGARHRVSLFGNQTLSTRLTFTFRFRGLNLVPTATENSALHFGSIRDYKGREFDRVAKMAKLSKSIVGHYLR